jgi:hypothetical protein
MQDQAQTIEQPPTAVDGPIAGPDAAAEVSNRKESTMSRCTKSDKGEMGCTNLAGHNGRCRVRRLCQNR